MVAAISRIPSGRISQGNIASIKRPNPERQIYKITHIKNLKACSLYIKVSHNTDFRLSPSYLK